MNPEALVVVAEELAPRPTQVFLDCVRNLIPSAADIKGLFRPSAVSAKEELTPPVRPRAVEAIEKVEDELGNLVKSVSPGIKDARWNMVLADDSSGRPVSQVIWNQMRLWRNDHATGFTPRLRFIAGGFHGKAEEPVGWLNRFLGRNPGFSLEKKQANLSARVAQLLPEIGDGRVLLVTEHIQSGTSLDRVAKALKEHGVKFDVATLFHNTTAKMEHLNGGTTIFSGRSANTWWDNPIYSRGNPMLRTAIGVEKWGSEAVGRAMRQDQNSMIEFRRSIAEMSDRIYFGQLWEPTEAPLRAWMPEKVIGFDF